MSSVLEKLNFDINISFDNVTKYRGVFSMACIKRSGIADTTSLYLATRRTRWWFGRLACNVAEYSRKRLSQVVHRIVSLRLFQIFRYRCQSAWGRRPGRPWRRRGGRCTCRNSGGGRSRRRPIEQHINVIVILLLFQATRP